VPVPLAERIVEVIADLGQGAGPRYRYGSGCIVCGRTVLTAAHVIGGAQVVQVRYPDKTLRAVKVDPRFVGGGEAPDLALVEIDDHAIDLAPIQLAVVDRDSPAATPVDGCHVVGYPRFMKRPSVGRETADAYGHIPVLTGLVAGLLTVQVTATPRPLPKERYALGDTEWAGISGAPVVADGCLLGVVIEHAPRDGASAITAVPLSALEFNPAHPRWGPGVGNARDWWARLGVAGLRELRHLPIREVRPEPAYWATVQEIHRRTPQLVGRERELAELAAFATGPDGYCWLKGRAWAGKSALIAEAVTAARPQSVDGVTYFLSRRESDANSNRFLAATVPQLAYILDEGTPNPSVEEFRDLWSRAAIRAAETGRHLLLVVDGLDEDLRPEGLPSVARLLPAEIRANVHVLVTSRPYLEPDVPARHPLLTVTPVGLDAFADADQVADLARQEIDDLLHGDDQDLAADVLGVLTAAAGALAIDDLAALTGEPGPANASQFRHVDRLVTEQAARSLQPVGPADRRRYQFAHGSLLEQAQTDQRLRVLRHPDYRRRIERWADEWQDARWPSPLGHGDTTPLYLLDEYFSTLTDRPQRRAALAGDSGWVAAALQTVGVDRLMADLDTAQSAGASPAAVSAMLTILRGQSLSLRAPQPIGQPSYILRQLCLQAAELGEDHIAADARERLMAQPDPGLVPLWTTRRVSRALRAESARHGGPVQTVAVLPDGRVISNGGDGRVRAWNPAVPDRLVELGGHGGSVDAVAVLPDGRVVSGSGDGRLRVSDPADAGASVVLGGGDPRKNIFATALAVLPDGRVVSGDDRGLQVWDPAAPDGAPVNLGRAEDWVSSLAVLSDGRIVSGGADGRVRAWDVTKPGAPVELGRHDGSVRALAVLPDGRVVSGADDGRIRIWDLTGTGTIVELGAHDGPVQALAVLPDGRIASGGGDRRVLVWDPIAPARGSVELGNHDQEVRAVAVLLDGRVATGSGSRLRVWDLSAIDGYSAGIGHHDDWATAVAVLPDGRVVTGGDDGRVRIWDPAKPGTRPAELGTHDGPVQAVAVLPDGRVVTGGDDGRVRIWDVTAAGTRTDLGAHDGSVQALAVLPDGRAVSGGSDGRVRIWDPADSGVSNALGTGSPANIFAVAVLPDGRVVSGGGKGVQVWDPAAPDAAPVDLGRPDEGWVSSLAVLPDGHIVSGGADGQVQIWDPALPGSRPTGLARQPGSPAVAVLPDGRVVTGGSQLRIWDVALKIAMTSSVCSVNAIAVAPNSTKDARLLTAHTGHGMTMWSLPGTHV
jgi:WD40 repeat protein